MDVFQHPVRVLTHWRANDFSLCASWLRLFQRQFDGLIHPLNLFEIHLISNMLRNLFQIFFVLLRKDDRLNPGPHSCEDFLLNPPHREDQTPQGDLARHGDVASHRLIR